MSRGDRGPDSRRGGGAPAQPTPRVEIEDPTTDPPIRFRYGGFEIAAKGASAVYALALFGCIVVGAKVAPPALDAVHDLTTAMQASAVTLRKASEDATAAREGVGRVEAAQVRVEERLGRIESDVGALRQDLRAACASRSSRP